MPVSGRNDLPGDMRDIRRVVEKRYPVLESRLTDRIPELPLLLTFDIGQVDIMFWLENRSVYPRCYWAARNGEFEFAGSGAALRVAVPDEPSIGAAYHRIDETLRLCDDDSPLFIGGQAFDSSSRPDSLWSSFRTLQFVSPETFVMRRGDRFTAGVTVRVKAGESTGELVARAESLLGGIRQETSRGRQDLCAEVLSRCDNPDFGDWSTIVRTFLGMIEDGAVEKVVLARRSDLTFGRPVDPTVFLDSLMRSGRSSFGFMFEPAEGPALVAVTPERLFKAYRGRLETEAVSGTVAKSAGRPRDSDIGGSLLRDEKNVREHGFVLDYITDKLAKLCESVDEPSDRIPLELSTVWHICTKLAGRLRPGVSTGDIVRVLHPTPAVCGTAKKDALRLIRDLEPFARGWYAGPVGVIGRGFCEMAVAIRSALVRGRGVSLFAGAGIVSGSEPRYEWMELEHKIMPAMEVFSGGGGEFAER